MELLTVRGVCGGGWLYREREGEREGRVKVWIANAAGPEGRNLMEKRNKTGKAERLGRFRRNLYRGGLKISR